MTDGQVAKLARVMVVPLGFQPLFRHLHLHNPGLAPSTLGTGVIQIFHCRPSHLNNRYPFFGWNAGFIALGVNLSGHGVPELADGSNWRAFLGASLRT